METKLILNDEVIEERLQEKGFEHPENMDDSQYRDAVLKYYEAEITDDWNGRCDAYIYSQSTADGYEVYMATEDERSPYYDQDLYYYENDLFEKLPDWIYNGYVIMVDSYLQDEYGFQDAIKDCYIHLYEEMEDEVKDELIDEGYEEEKAE